MAPSQLIKDSPSPPDLSKPRWDQSSFGGRARHFFTTVNPSNLFVSSRTLDESKRIVDAYRRGKFDPEMTVDELWRAKQIYDSAFHPETGEKQFILGRMSAQVPCNMVITGGMLTFYRSFAGVVFWQWLNQSFNAVVNYTNRSGPSAASNERLFVSYLCATGGALSVALGLNRLLKNNKSTLLGRLVPFCAIALANAINIPMMRSSELSSGVMVEDERGRPVGQSSRVAALAISQVTLSRIGMATPYMIATPVIMNAIARTKWYKTRPWVAGPIQTALAGLILLVSTPFCCALFPQKASISVSKLEPALQARIRELPDPPCVVFYNKGL